MTLQIWKYPLAAGDQTISMPRYVQILTAQMQGDVAVLWALVRTENEHQDVAVSVYGTGHDLPDSPGQYVATVQVATALVAHVFDRGPVR